MYNQCIVVDFSDIRETGKFVEIQTTITESSWFSETHPGNSQTPF